VYSSLHGNNDACAKVKHLMETFFKHKETIKELDRHKDYISVVDLAKQLEERDAKHEAEIAQLKSQLQVRLDKKERMAGQLEKYTDMLATSEIDASSTKKELTELKESAEGWELQLSKFNADMAGKPLAFLLPNNISHMPTHSLLQNLILS
jgi:chromosome segregation ATPase